MLAITSGIVVTYLTEYGLAHNGGWRWMLALGAVSAFGWSGTKLAFTKPWVINSDSQTALTAVLCSGTFLTWPALASTNANSSSETTIPIRLPVDAGGLHDDMRRAFRCKPNGEAISPSVVILNVLIPCCHLALHRVTNAGHHCLLVNIETGTMRMQKFHRSSSAPLPWNPDLKNPESVLRSDEPGCSRGFGSDCYTG
jgi:uncharacterized membrane protein